MPREVYIIDDFSGGLVNAISPRNRKDNEMGELRNCYVIDSGKVQMLGGFTYNSNNCWILNVPEIVKWPDQNIFPFSLDFAYNGSSIIYNTKYYMMSARSASASYTPSPDRAYLMVGDANGELIGHPDNSLLKYIWMSDTAVTTDQTIQVTYYIADGAVRACDGANWTHKRIWFGLVDRTLFPNAPVQYDISEGLRSFDASVSLPPDGSLVYTGGGAIAGVEAAYTTKSTTELGGLNTNANYAVYNQAINANDFNTAWTTANLSMDLVDSITLQLGCYGKLGEDWVTTFAIRAGTLSAGVFAEAKYQWYYDAGLGIYSRAIWQSGEESQVYTHMISFPEGLDISGGGSARLAVQNLVNTSTAPFRVEYVRFDGRSLIGGAISGYYPSGAGTVGVVVGNSTKEADYWVGNFNFGITHVYDEEQESLVRQIKTEDGAEFVYLSKAPYVKTCLDYTNGWSERVTGVNVYCKKQGESTWLSLIENNFVTGQAFKTGTEEKYAVTYSTTDSGWEYMVTPTTYEPFLSHESKTGIPAGTTTLDAKWKTATVANRIAYIGGVKMGDIYYEDAIFKSYVNKFDTFSKDRRLEANINDGDKIIHLEVYNDKLFEFKNNKINIINISDPEGEYLEETLYYNGIATRRNVVKTELGIFWMNNIGVFWHDGDRVQELFYELKDPSRRRISNTYWESFITKAANPSLVNDVDEFVISYDNVGKVLLIMNPISSTNDSLIYSIQTDTWFDGNKLIAAADVNNEKVLDLYSNHEGRIELVMLPDWSSVTKPESRFMFWDNTPRASTGFLLSTKDIDMGYPGLKKNLYQVYITSKGSGGSVRVRYSVNGSEEYKLPFYSDVTSDVIPSATSLANSSQASKLWSSSTTVSQRFYVPAFITTRNKHSFRIWLDFIRSTLVSSPLAVPATFQLEDISLIYRGRGKR